MRSPAKEARDPNQVVGGTATKKRASQSGIEASPAKKQQRKKLSKKDRRRVSFAPDPELTLVHEFFKDDDCTSNSDGHGKVVVQCGEEEQPAAVQHSQPSAQHPALVGGANDSGGGYRPGFWNKTVPENSPLSDRVPIESPGMVSMEITQPTVQVQQAPIAGAPGEVTAGLPSLGDLAAADEFEDVVEEDRQQMQRLPAGEVTAALPSLGALADADEWEDGQGVQGHEAEAASWAAAAAAANVTVNITAALPGLGALVAEDEDATAGMDLTLPTGRVLDHNFQQPSAMAAPPALSPAAASPSQQGQLNEEPHPALAPADETPAQEAQLEPTAQLALSMAAAAGSRRRSSSTDELANGEEAKVQLNKWGFAPGAEDTLDINLEMHGRMIMGDQTFIRMYCDNTTGDSRYAGRPSLSAGTADSPVDSPGLQEGGAEDLELEGDEEAALAHGDTSTAEPAGAAANVAAAASPAMLQSGQQHPAQPLAPASPAGAAQVQPDWKAPAFLPPYMEAPAGSSAPSDHPALVHSPDVTNSSLNTLETRRVSVGMDMRRMSINSRRCSMQDATGRLLADYDDSHVVAAVGLNAFNQDLKAQAALPAVQAPVSAGTRSRQHSSGAAFLGRGDMTEKLLVDDSLDEEGEPDGPLANLKRQMRILSQGSPVLVPQLEKAAKQAAAEEALVAATNGQPPPNAQQMPAAKSPRATVSLGCTDSHNPATVGLLRSGGTTRLLLQETVQVLGAEADGGFDDGLIELQQHAAAAGGAAAGMRDGQLGDGAITVRTNGTTKLLADMTMASMVGAKLLGQAAQGAPELAPATGNDGLTGFSLDEFEHPPELSAGQRQQQQHEDEAMEVEGELGAVHARQQPQHGHAEDDYASPALAPAAGEFGAGYPISAELSDGVAIPGGPKLARTPVPVPAAQTRSTHGTPHSNARSVRSQQQQHMQHHMHAQATPGTQGAHGSHRLARTPGSMRPGGPAAYPQDEDVTVGELIPGGPKLARTPLGRTPAAGHLAPPGSAVAQHYPGSVRAVQFAVGPGSTSVGRYPGSAVALHRGGMTPQMAPPPPLTFQDFARVTEVQFLDNLRRGASINYADLQPNPVPQNLGEAYRLLAIISPQVTTLENGIRILQEEVQSRRVSAADAEQLVGQVNPAAFQKVQAADEEGLEEMREHVGLLKRVCRQKAVYCLKDVRRQMEESRGARLQRNLEALQRDLAFAQANKEQLEAVAKAAEQYIAEQHRRIAQDEQEQREEAERRTAVLGMRRSIAEEAAGNEQRRQRLREVQEQAAKLREEHSSHSREREALRRRTDALQMTLMQSQGQEGVGRESSPLAVMEKLEGVDVLTACLGWQLEVAQEDPVSGEVALRLAHLFRLRLTISKTHAAASVEVLTEEDCKVPSDRRALLAVLAGCPEGSAAAEVQLAEPSVAKVAALVQATTTRLSRVADLAAELDGLRLAYPALCDVSCRPDGWLLLSFVNLDAEVKFTVSLQLPCSYPSGPVQHEAKIWFEGEGQVTEQRIAQAVAAAEEAPGRLRAICRELSQLARDVVPRPALSQDPAFHSNWQNPLFSAALSVSTQT